MTEQKEQHKKSGLISRALNFSSSISFKYRNNKVGATLALPLMIFNAYTTVEGAKLILPATIGIPVAVWLSVIYFFIVVSLKVKSEHPLRRLLLIVILGLASLYTSFFAIYNEVSEGQLEYQSFKKTVDAHNDFVKNIRATIVGQINKIEEKEPDIVLLGLKRQQFRDLSNERDRLQSESAQGPLAESISAIAEEIKSLRLIESSPEYRIHSRLSFLKNTKVDKINLLTTEDFLNSQKDVTAIFAENDALHSEISNQLAEIDPSFSQILSIPVYDDYVKTPLFLIPLEMAYDSESQRQFNFVLFAFIVSITLEAIPILVGGINILSDPKQKNINKNNNSDSDEADNQEGQDSQNKNKFHERNKYVSSDQEKPRKTVMIQISNVLTSFVRNLRQLNRDVFDSINTKIGITDTALEKAKKSLGRAMKIAEIKEKGEGGFKEQLLVDFYLSIDPIKRTIPIISHLERTSLPQGSSKIASNYMIPKAFLIDVMRHPEVGWITKKNLFTKPLDSDFLDDKWHFVDELKYHEFLDWFLKELGDDELSNSDNSEEISAYVELDANGNLDLSEHL